MKHNVFVIVTGIYLLSSTAYAQTAYVGIGAGSARYYDNILDDTDTGLNIYGGIKFNEYFGLELSYTDFGKQEDEFTSVYTFDVSVEVVGLGFSAVGFLPISDNLGLLGKLGVIDLEADLTFDAHPESKDGSDLFYGIGAEYRLSEQFSFRSVWEIVVANRADFDMLSINAQFNF
jgi:OOP family OmpA-OmpF porin